MLGCEQLLSACPVVLSSAVVRRDAFDEAGGFDNQLAIVQDWELWLRMIELGRFLFIDDPLVEYRVSPHNKGQLSGDPWRAYSEGASVYRRLEKAAEEHGERRPGGWYETGTGECDEADRRRLLRDSSTHSGHIRSGKCSLSLSGSIEGRPPAKWPRGCQDAHGEPCAASPADSSLPDPGMDNALREDSHGARRPLAQDTRRLKEHVAAAKNALRRIARGAAGVRSDRGMSASRLPTR